MGFLLFAGRLVLLLGLYAFTYGIAREIWRGLPDKGVETYGLRTVRLSLRQAAGAVQADGNAWREGTERALPLPVTFGRQAGNTVRVEDPFVSSCHAELSTDGPSLWLIDRGSKNGTWIGRKRLAQPVEVLPGTEFRFGSTVIRLEE
ncbi:MAG: FHA domain-containing protein [Bacteroidota bacterium]